MARILIIEDELPILLLLKRILAGSGHEVMTASEGGIACSVATDNKLDLVLSDLSMPGDPSGMDLLREIRKLRPECPLVVVSGYSSEDTIAECKSIGVADFLPKPFELTFVRSFVDSILRSAAQPTPVHS
jgi:DNA-binding NtrC family response regulator